MHTFSPKLKSTSPKLKSTQKTKSAALKRQGRTFPEQRGGTILRSIANPTAEQPHNAPAHGLKPETHTVALPRFAHDFSRIPVHADSRTGTQPNLQADAQADANERPAGRVVEPLMHMPELRPQRAFGEATGGSPSRVPYRNEMEYAFGEDFSGVDAYFGRSTAMNRLNAHAATYGEQIAFGGFSPDKRLVAHELTHVVQQRRGGGLQLKSQLSGIDDAAEREADSVAARAASGERVDVSAAPSAAIHRDMKDKNLDVPLGHFEINMTKVEAKDSISGESGTLSFTANDKAPDSKSIRLSQAVKDFNVAAGADWDWVKDGPVEQANLGKMQSVAGDKIHITAKNETLKTIAGQHYGEPSRFPEIFAANKVTLDPTMKTADADKTLPESLSLTIPKAVRGGFFIDHAPDDPKAKVRKAKTDPAVPQDYVWPGEEVGKKNQHGSKAGKTIVPAVITDSPQTNQHLQYTFETVARSEDVGIHYGTVHWSFEADGPNGKVTKESYRVAPGVSDTFRAALHEFTKFYKNPHTVMKGETLRTIAEQYYGDRAKSGEILKANADKLKDPDKLPLGLKLNIPIIGP
jgi:nucleoid-associated protein YgaU